MELAVYQLLTAVTIFFTYLSYSRLVDQTDLNKVLSGLLWIVLALNTFVIHYYLPNGSVSSYTPITKNSEYWQTLLALVYGVIGFSIWIQLAIDRGSERREYRGV